MAASYNTTDLQILKALWNAKRMGAREVHDALSADTGWSYSTTRTLLARMAEKGIVTGEDFHVWRCIRPLRRVCRCLARLHAI